MARKSPQPRASASFRSASPIVRTFGWAWAMPSPAMTCECAIRPSCTAVEQRPRKRRWHPPCRSRRTATRFGRTITQPGTGGSHDFSMAPRRLDQQAREFGVLGDIGADKGAFGDNLQRLGLHRLEGATRKLRADAAAGERLWHFRVGEGDHAWGETVVGECLVAVDVEFEAMVQRVLAD